MNLMNQLSLLYKKVSGMELSPKIQETIKNLIQLSGDEDYFPEFLIQLTTDLIKGIQQTDRPITPPDTDYLWLLREMQPLLPQSTYTEKYPDYDILFIPKINTSVKLNYAPHPSYEIIQGAYQAAKMGSNKSNILDTASPSLEQVRQWAYNSHLSFLGQDDHAILHHPSYLEILIELAADPNCPRQELALGIADGLVAGILHYKFDLDLLQKAKIQAQATQQPILKLWADNLDKLSHYLTHVGETSFDTARDIAHIIMIGYYRKGLSLTISELQGWWEFAACHEAWDAPLDRLYISKDYGGLIWSKKELSVNQLEANKVVKQRDDSLLTIFT